VTAVVMKFGGSSVADIARIKRVAEHVVERRKRGDSVCVVVSAMGKTTDGLIAQAKEIAKEPARRELDMLLTIGERASAALLTMALIDVGVDAISFTGSQSGIITNATHAGARILEVRPYRVQDELEKGRVVVIAGFQGVSYAKEITTLGRGGSDTTAVALAAALDATCEIYSDVDGVWTSDPRVVPSTKKIESLSYEEMQELAEAGAKVLNAQAVQFAKAKGIAIFALKTPHFSSTSGAETGTVVRKDAPAPVGGVRGVAHRAKLHSLVADEIASVSSMLAHLRAHHIPSGQLVALARGGVEVLIPPEDAHGFESCCAKLPHGISRGSDHGAVSLVGQGMLEDKHVVIEGLDVLASNQIKPRGMSTSSFRVTFLLDPSDVENAARALHAKFVVTERIEAAT
jgi:aspartate kinase